MARKKNRKEKRQEQDVVEEVVISSQKTEKTLTVAWSKQQKILFWSVLVLIFATFLPALSNSFVFWDDPEYVYQNPFFKKFSLTTVFSTSTFYMGNYHPLSITWLYWESLIFPSGNFPQFNGMDPFWFHLNNLLLHIANTVLVFFLVQELTNKKQFNTALVTAVLFGIHPMHVESVAWISELKDVLYTFFFLLSAWAYLKYVNQKLNIKWGILAFVCFLFSNLSKAQAVTLPVVLVLIDLYKKRKIEIKMLVEKIPFFALSIYFGLLAIDAQKAESAVNANYQGLDTLFYGSYGILVYLYKLFLPIGLSGAHPYPTNPVFEDLPTYFSFLPLGVIALGIATFIFGKKHKEIWFGVLFFLITVSIVLKFVPVGDTITAERYTYVPYIGLFFIVGTIYTRLVTNSKYEKIAQGSMLFIVLILSVITWNRTKVWENSFTFWEDVSEKYPNYWRSYNCIGQEYAKNQQYHKAIEQYTKAVEMDKWAPPVPYLLRGAVYTDNLKDYDKAIADYKKVISFPSKNDPSQIDGRHNLGLTYFRKGDYQNAIVILTEAIQMSPNNPRGYYFRGLAEGGANKNRKAVADYTKTLELNPNYLAAYINRGVIYTDKTNQFDLGIADFKNVLKFNPQHQDANINIGLCLYKKGAFQQALKQYDKCLQLFPDNPRIYYLKALVYAQNNDFATAVKFATKAEQMGMNLGDIVQQWKAKT